MLLFANGRGNAQSIVQSKVSKSLESAAESGLFAVVFEKEGLGRQRITPKPCVFCLPYLYAAVTSRLPWPTPHAER